MKTAPIELTHGEEQVMRMLWLLGKGSVNDLIDAMEEPKPKYTTVATFIKILTTKGFVGYEIVGKGHLYYPLVTKEAYARSRMNTMLSDYFDGSIAQVISLFTQHEDISVQEMEQILELMKKAKK